ncbi:MAG TPA: class I SAM-dependent methyltransferase [Prolixibacteraceae bacterium]|nr:class I SAM-dependent methyltransferase [Prolixibacteraceae bacterium]HPS12766.1 class I SAM-dependent methyltransferase [Prolixibacteraceae bacterium]
MENQKVCPWWLGYTFLIPLRKYQHDPYKIVGSHVKKGMTVMDFGCAMGYFSIPLAKMTGPNGKVYCVDIQEKMLERLEKRAKKRKVSSTIKPLLAGKSYNPAALKEQLDFALLFMVAHEVPDQTILFRDLFTMLKPGGKVLFFEPEGHVKREAFERSLKLAIATGFTITDKKPVKGLSALLLK